MNALIGSHDVLFIVLDSLRYDVAAQELEAGRIPHLAVLFEAWEKRHTPGSFTLAAHQAFFAGFCRHLPIRLQIKPGSLRVDLMGSETIGPTTKVFEDKSWITGAAAMGYRTLLLEASDFSTSDHRLVAFFLISLKRVNGALSLA